MALGTTHLAVDKVEKDEQASPTNLLHNFLHKIKETETKDIKTKTKGRFHY